jgi:divalent metal cation (Fe/Co/Zn/Cd) transporter
VRAGRSWWSFVRHAKSPELPVILLEDLGALTGLAFALMGVGLSAALGDSRYDALATIAIGILLGGIAVVLASEMKSLLIGEAAGTRDLAAIRSAVEQTPRVRRLIHMRTLHIGPDALLVGAKVELDPRLDFAQVADAINAIEANVRSRVAKAEIIYIEPDVHVTPPAPPAGAPNPSA